VSVRNLKIIPHIIDPVQDVTTNIDFNDYKKEGKYLIWASHQTNNTNAPDTQGGLLEVEIIPNGIKQTLTQYYVANPKIYYRIFHATAGWRGRKEIAVTSDVVAKSDVVNNLTSTSTTAPLAANQGKVLNEKFNVTSIGIFVYQMGTTAYNRGYIQYWKVGDIMIYTISLTGISVGTTEVKYSLGNNIPVNHACTLNPSSTTDATVSVRILLENSEPVLALKKSSGTATTLTISGVISCA